MYPSVVYKIFEDRLYKHLINYCIYYILLIQYIFFNRTMALKNVCIYYEARKDSWLLDVNVNIENTEKNKKLRYLSSKISSLDNKHGFEET